MSNLTDIPESFARLGYVVVRGLVSVTRTGPLSAHLRRCAEKGWLRENDAQVAGAPSVHGDPFLDALLEELRPTLEVCTGLRLWSTYSYARLYRNGDELKPHRDRPACEISLSLNLGQTPAAEPWALNVKGPAGTAAALLMPGDGLLYRGMELVHWREPYQGEHLAQVFLHYVDRDGPHAGQRYDRRDGLGLPAVPRD